MTKKDYELISASIYVALKDASLSPHTWNPDTVEFVARRLSGTLANENPRFNGARFLAACGVQA